MGYLSIYETAHGAIARPFKCVCDCNPLYSLKIMLLKGLNSIFKFSAHQHSNFLKAVKVIIVNVIV